MWVSRSAGVCCGWTRQHARKIASFITSQHQTATTKSCNCSPFDVRFDSVPIEIISCSLKCWFMFLTRYELPVVSPDLGNSYMFLFTFRTFTTANVLYVFRTLNLALITARKSFYWTALHTNAGWARKLILANT